MDESNIQRKSLPVENSCSLITKLNNSVCTNTSSYEETSLENCSVDHEADLKHSIEIHAALWNTMLTLNLSSQKQPKLATPKTMWDSLDSTNRNNATVLYELSPPEMSAARIERVETHASRLHKDAFEFSEVGDSCKDNDKIQNYDMKHREHQQNQTNKTWHPRSCGLRCMRKQQTLFCVTAFGEDIIRDSKAL
ncbi:putative chromatin remodeling complex subunit [Prunus yedoensis var. nudiflora]|uniref:Putative chromatin remodeling complex subunit n=1 Tax=Prunus yedoensis var. nudiflora TaxID=2094558 RepID=A0A314Y3Z5_PRUYE|nr:putative chromatin remodeling complex subunit [Prunus yedoensis var. nudiflora]